MRNIPMGRLVGRTISWFEGTVGLVHSFNRTRFLFGVPLPHALYCTTVVEHHPSTHHACYTVAGTVVMEAVTFRNAFLDIAAAAAVAIMLLLLHTTSRSTRSLVLRKKRALDKAHGGAQRRENLQDPLIAQDRRARLEGNRSASM